MKEVGQPGYNYLRRLDLDMGKKLNEEKGYARMKQQM